MTRQSEIAASIKFAKVGGQWGIKINDTDFSSCSIDIKINRNDSHEYCRNRVYENIKFAQDSSGRWGVANYFASKLERRSDHDHVVDLKGKNDDNATSDGVALKSWAINAGNVNISSSFSSSQLDGGGSESDDLKFDNQQTFHRFSTLEGIKEGGGVLDYQNNPTADGRKAPEVSSSNSGADFPKTLKFYDARGGDVNAELILDSPSLSIKKTPSLETFKMASTDGTYKSKTIRNNKDTIVSRSLVPGLKTFYAIQFEGNAGGASKVDNSTLTMGDSCDGDGITNTTITIDCIHNIVLSGPPDLPDPVDPAPDPLLPPTVTTVTAGASSCPTDPDWSNGWAGSYRPNCASNPSTDRSEESKGGLILNVNPGDPKRFSLSFGELAGSSNPIRQQLGLSDLAGSPSLANKLITIRVDWYRQALWAQNFSISGSCSDSKNGGSTSSSGASYSTSISHLTGSGDISPQNREFVLYNIEGGSTIEFTCSSTPGTRPDRTRYTGETETVTLSGPSGDPPVITRTVTKTCIPPGGIYENYDPWPPCPEEVVVTKSGGTTATAVYSDGAPDGANDQFITITLLAVRESVLDIPTNSIGMVEELLRNVWVADPNPGDATADNLGAVDGRSLADYHEHPDKTRFRNPIARTSATSLSAGGTGMGELKGHSGAMYPGTIDSAVTAAGSSLPINLSNL
jgi:hypothetical protein